MTQDLPNWFIRVGADEIFRRHLVRFKNTRMRCLQVGAYTGDATSWLVQHILLHEDSYLVDVDTWTGSSEEEHRKIDWSQAEKRYNSVTKSWRESKKVIKVKSTSDEFFAKNKDTFDFIYVDGDHTAYGVMKDAINAYECLSVGGVLAFDDYMWQSGKGVYNEPKVAIDAFLAVYGDRVKLMQKSYQVWCVKTA
jgi:hypothetical protein